MRSNEPYIQVTRLEYNPDYGDERLCVCGHTYYRHFDGYDRNSPIGCKYCGSDCRTFVEEAETIEAKLKELELKNTKLRNALWSFIHFAESKSFQPFGQASLEEEVERARRALSGENIND